MYIGKAFNEWKDESTCKSDAASPRYTLESSLDLDLDLVLPRPASKLVRLILKLEKRQNYVLTHIYD